jgi:hypothetical protein
MTSGRSAVDAPDGATLIADVQRYEPRPIRFHRLLDVDGWRLKLYSIAFESKPIDWSAFEPALAMIDVALPRPAIAPACRSSRSSAMRTSRPCCTVTLASLTRPRRI